MAILGQCCYFLVFLVLILSQASGFVVENSLEEKVVVEENPQEKADKEPDCFICQLLVGSFLSLPLCIFYISLL